MTQPQQPFGPAQWGQPQPPQKKTSVGKKIAIGVGAAFGGLLMLGACGAILSSSEDGSTSSKPAATAKPAATTPAGDEDACKQGIRKLLDKDGIEGQGEYGKLWTGPCKDISNKRREELIDQAGAEKLKDLVGDATSDKPEPKPAARAEWTDGKYIVGDDIKPGTYVSKGATAGLFELCTASTETADGNVHNLDNGNKGDQVIIVVDSSDKFVEFSGCEPFTRR